ncbi:zinc finger BED domain-containing protein RICESLEEPER 2-like isoform X2 [Arachis hypogaea]|uniref:zinc finger BED domain-containing protein RICESLEEPER 2-like isoform X2 n=1 Tax=Arachis hypogaea TaxID=3818 RepID=UPI003B223217
MGHSLTRDCSAGLGSSSGAAESKMTENSNIEAAGMSASTQPSSPLSGVRKDRSAVWDHFDVENDTEKKAKCKYCGSLIQYWNGTSSMGGHLRRCKQNPNNDSNKRKITTTPTIDEHGALNSPSASKFDQEEAQRALVEMFIGEELPFRFVESPKFRRFVHALQATFKVPSQTTLARDIGALNAEEKMKLQDFLSANCGRVCLTTNTWTSIQNFTYMSLTAHFVDLDWKLHKKIVNICQIFFPGFLKCIVKYFFPVLGLQEELRITTIELSLLSY